MAKQKVTFANWLQTGLIRLCRVHFVFVGIYTIYTIAADSTHLITPKLVLERWEVNVALLIGASIVWYLARNKITNSNYYRVLIYILIVLDIFMASFNIYTERGMASRAVALFALAIVSSAILLSRTALFLTATVSTAAYSLAAVKYFVDFFNEGYKAELYIEVAFYCAFFFVLAGLLSIIIRFKNTENNLGL